MSGWIARTALAEALGDKLDTLIKQCERQGWTTRATIGPTGKVVEVHIPSLPERLRLRLAEARARRALSNMDSAPRHAASLAALDQVAPAALELALAKARVVELADAYLLGQPHGQRTQALARWLGQFSRGLVDARLAELVGPVSRRTLDGWRQQYRTEGLAALVDRRGRPRGVNISDEIRRFVEDCIYAAPLISAQKIHRLALFRFRGTPLPSDRSLRRYAGEFRASNKAALTMLSKPSVFKRWYQISLGRADADLSEPNQRWEADSTRMDLMTSDGKRATCVNILDVWTRRRVVGVYERGGAAPINQTMFKALRKLGVPRQIIFDRGKDYQSNEVQALCLDLGIDAPEIPGYSPELKPHAEISFHATRDLLQALTGYTGNSLAVRPESIQTRHTLAELQALADKWVLDYEHHHVVRTTGATPMQRWGQALAAGWSPDTVDEAALRILLKAPVERGITQGRIRFEGGDYSAEELDLLEPTTRVLVRPDPEDAGILYVFDEERNFLCIAQDLRRLALTPAQVTARKKDWWRIRKLERKAALMRAAALDLDTLEAARLDEAVASLPAEAPLPAATLVLPEISAAAEARQALMDDRVEERRERTAKEADPEARPDFAAPVERYEWTMRRLGQGLAVEAEDREFVAEFEGSRLWRLNGGEAYRAQLLGQRAAVAYAC
ncbi:MAG: DDE-type integrase/transposase/recombinase [Desulfarculus sp.]|nr:DDE-type integrase/transposase/recombinase [Desulfarculus sp.]